MPAQSAIVAIVGGVAQRALQPFVISKMPLVIGKIKFVSTFIILKRGEKIFSERLAIFINSAIFEITEKRIINPPIAVIEFMESDTLLLNMLPKGILFFFRSYSIFFRAVLNENGSFFITTEELL